MPEIRLVVVVLSASILVGLAPACVPRDACAPVLQSVAILDARLEDADRARSELEASGLRDRLVAEDRATFDAAVDLLAAGHRIGVQTLAMVRDVCEEPDIRGALELVVRGWELVAPLLALVGGRGTPDVVPPVVWVEARR